MARQKTNKTAKKRVNFSNPRGNRAPVVKYKQSHQGHLKTGKSSRAKRRQSSSIEVVGVNSKKLIKKIVNI